MCIPASTKVIYFESSFNAEQNLCKDG